MKDRGIYDLDTILAGFPALPVAAATIPDCFRVLGFDRIPEHSEVAQRYRELAKSAHPDAGGNEDWFKTLNEAHEQAEKYFEKGGI